MMLANLLMAVSALVHALAGGAAGQPSRNLGQRYYHCDFAPGVEFFVSDRALMPAYRCVSGRVQLFIASQDFRAPYSDTQWIEELDVKLGDDVLTQVFPGSFHYVRGSVHRPVHGLEFKSPNLAINGLTVLSARRLY